MTGINSYSITAANNVQAVTGIDWDEGMAPGQVNNSARQNMADLRAAFNDLIWFQYGVGDEAVAPAYASGTSFTLAGADASAVWHAGRRVKAVGSSTGTIYGAIASAAYASSTTTVNVIWDSGALANESLTLYLSQIPVLGAPVGSGAIATPPLLQNYYTGLTLSAAGSSASFGIAAGQAADSGNAVLMTLAAAITKTTSGWTVGSGNGALDTGAIANSTWYHVWLIRRPDTGVVDVLASLSATSPTLPSGYTQKRRIGAMLTDASAHWVAFTQVRTKFRWVTPTTDFANTSGVTTRVTQQLTVPTGTAVQPDLLFSVASGASGSSAFGYAILTSLNEFDTVPSNTINSGWVNAQNYIFGSTTSMTTLNTNTLGQIGRRAATLDSALLINTCGWDDIGIAGGK